MATDIWIHIEYKSKTGNWVELCEPYEDRIYGLFGALAGARTDIEPIYPPRGLPQDISFDTLDKYEEGKEDYHTESWLTFSELKQCMDYAKIEINKRRVESGYEELPQSFLYGYNAIYNYMKAFEDVGFETRIVFWFDN